MGQRARSDGAHSSWTSITRCTIGIAAPGTLSESGVSRGPSA